ncbi:MAG TPA: hypothetical protein VFW73_10545 [Lacipirellulaceae bacterium]|nr:hypothetical protein [Lacipirellulaceae bacterium]
MAAKPAPAILRNICRRVKPGVKLFVGIYARDPDNLLLDKDTNIL